MHQPHPPGLPLAQGIGGPSQTKISEPDLLHQLEPLFELFEDRPGNLLLPISHLEGIETGDSIEIKGTPDVSLKGSPEIPGGVATTALAVNMIPRVLTAPPGLSCMADLPVPAAVLGHARRLIGARSR